MSSTGANDTWLIKLIRQAINENCCFQVGCTTCGAQKFGSLLMMALVREYKQLRIAGVEFTMLHAELLSGALANLNEEDLPIGNETSAALEFIVTVTWRAMDAQGQERLQQNCRARFLRRMLFKSAPELKVRATTAVMMTPPTEWDELSAELSSHGRLTPKVEQLLKSVSNGGRMIPSAEQCLELLDLLEEARGRKDHPTRSLPW